MERVIVLVREYAIVLVTVSESSVRELECVRSPERVDEDDEVFV